MANVPQKTLSWLWDVLREYRNPNRTYTDVAQTLSKYPSFAPRTDVYTFENGAHSLLIHILGTVPVNFRGTTYRFPIALWIPYAYPHEPPIIYVTPTEDMVVRQGQHVAGDGRVYHQYLAHWKEAWDRSNLVDFLSILADTFAKEPPVISKSQASRRVQQQPPPPPPRPLLPHDAQPSPSLPPTPTSQDGPPPPPKQFVGESTRSQSPAQAIPGRYAAPPPLPSQTQSSAPTSTYAPRGDGSIPQLQRSSQYSPQRVNSLRQGPPQQWQPQPQPPQPQQGQPPPPAQHQHPPFHLQQHHNVPPHAVHLYQQHVAQHPPPRQLQKAPQPSLLDSPFDIPLPVSQQNLPAPPIPRNPEKDALLSHISSILTSTLHSQINQNTSAIQPLQSQNAALNATIPRLHAELASLSSLQETLKSNISMLQNSMSQADSTIASARRRSAAGDIPKVDMMLVPPHVVGKQLYDTVTEERGIEAAILALQEAFVRGRVSSEVWSRRTRELAREGFRKKYLCQKVGSGMGLDM